MRTKQREKLGLTRSRDANVLVITQTVLAAMTDNEKFDEPPSPLVEFEAVLDEFADKLSEARKRGSPYDTAAKNEARKNLEASLAELAFYVNKVAKGNLPAMLSSGFPISRDRNREL